MKKYLVLLALMFSTTTHANIINGFTGPYDIANWTISTNGGAIDTSGAPGFITAISSNAGNDSSVQDFTIAAITGGDVQFNWNYTTYDSDGPSYDPFGWLLNGTFFSLTNASNAYVQSGLTSFSVAAGDIFGFRAVSTDSSFGSAVTTVSNFSVTSVPEPATLALLGIGLLGVSVACKRKKRQA